MVWGWLQKNREIHALQGREQPPKYAPKKYQTFGFPLRNKFHALDNFFCAPSQPLKTVEVFFNAEIESLFDHQFFFGGGEFIFLKGLPVALDQKIKNSYKKHKTP